MPELILVLRDLLVCKFQGDLMRWKITKPQAKMLQNLRSCDHVLCRSNFGLGVMLQSLLEAGHPFESIGALARSLLLNFPITNFKNCLKYVKSKCFNSFSKLSRKFCRIALSVTDSYTSRAIAASCKVTCTEDLWHSKNYYMHAWTQTNNSCFSVSVAFFAFALYFIDPIILESP